MRFMTESDEAPIFSSLTEDRTLHEQELPVQLVYPNRDRENRTAGLIIRVKSRTDSGQKTTNFLVEIVDEQDPLFLYTVSIGESEFHELKNDQNLIIDYSQFHVHFIDILQRVKGPSSRYEARLVLPKNPQEMAEFGIHETSEFRRLDQIKLKAVQATDSTLKKHLSLNIKALKTRCSTLQLECDEYQLILRQKESEFLNLQKDYENSVKSFQAQKNSMTVDFSEKLSSAKEESARQQRKTEIQFDEEKKQLESDYKLQLSSLSSKLESVQMQNQELSQSNFNLNHTVKNLHSKIALQSKDLEHFTTENNRLKTLKESSDSQVLSLEKEIGRLSSRVAFLEQQLTDKESLCQKVQSLLDASNEQKSHLEQSVALLREASQKDERRVNECSKEIKKGNQIIHTLQAELKSSKSKYKHSATIIVKQEAELEKMKKEIENVNLTNSELRTDYKKLQADMQAKESTICQLNKDLEESKEIISRNQTMIANLTGQLHERESSRIPGLLPNRQPVYKSSVLATPPSLQKPFEGIHPFSPTGPMHSRLDYATTPGRPSNSYGAPASSAFFPSVQPASTPR